MITYVSSKAYNISAKHRHRVYHVKHTITPTPNYVAHAALNWISLNSVFSFVFSFYSFPFDNRFGFFKLSLFNFFGMCYNDLHLSKIQLSNFSTNNSNKKKRNNFFRVIYYYYYFLIFLVF